MITFKDWFISFAAAGLLAFSAFASAAKLSFRVIPEQIQPGEHAALEVTFSPSGKDEVPVLQDELLGKTESIQWLGKSSKEENGNVVWKFEFTAYDTGEVTIPPVEVQYGSESFSTESKRVKVSTTRPEGDENLRAEYGAMGLPIQWKAILARIAWALVATLAVMALGFLIKGWWRRPKKLASEGKSPPAENPLLWLQSQLSQLKARLESETTPARPIDELTQILRSYFAKTSQSPVETWTTREFRLRFSRDEMAQQIAQLLEDCDELKFTGRHSQSTREAAFAAVSESERILFS